MTEKCCLIDIQWSVVCLIPLITLASEAPFILLKIRNLCSKSKREMQKFWTLLTAVCILPAQSGRESASLGVNCFTIS